MRTRLALTGAALVAAGALMAGLVPGVALGSAEPARAHVAALRQAIAKYQDVSVALADGFVPSEHCIDSPAGGMGLHYVNPQRASAPLDPDSPAVLLYRATRGGSLELEGAEYFVPDADQDLGTTDDRPFLWGQPFDGPMPGHEPGMPVHYDLHVWTHVANPDGVFAPWNPRVHC